MTHRRLRIAIAFVSTVLLAVVTSTVQAAVAPARIFSDHMVLQCDHSVPVWGAADAGATVVVEFGDQRVSAKADESGRWRVSLAPLKASSTARDMTIRAGDERVVIHDVLVGEVWFAGGQSNMAYTAGQMADQLPEGRALVEAADLPTVRFRRINERDAPQPQRDLTSGEWSVCTPQSVRAHSAVCFVFARRLHEELHVPVGMIDCSWGGTPIEPYIPASAFTGHPTLEKLAAYAKAGDVDAIKALPGGTFVRSSAWLAGAIYNGRIAPVAPYAIRGAIWYQGESNCGTGEDPRDYAHKMRALIAGWRTAWERDDLPVYYVQLPQWKSYAWTYLRQEQLRALDTPNTGMAVTIDLDNANNIHPPNKIDVGERLARWPLAQVYSRNSVVSGPLYRDVSIQGSAVVVRFDHADGGLMVGRLTGAGQPIEPSDAALHGFEVAGEDGVWRPAAARIDGATVIVASDQVKSPVAVRYACHPEASKDAPWNLYNKAGLPASPFCSDWSRMAYDPAKNPMPK